MPTIGSSDQVTHTQGPNNPLNGGPPATVKDALINTNSYFTIWGVLFDQHLDLINALDTRTTSLEEVNVSFDERLVTVEQANDDYAVRVPAVEARADALEARATALEAADVAIRADATNLAGSVYVLGLQVAALQATLNIVPRFVKWTGTAYPSRPVTDAPVFYLDGPGPDGTNHTGTAPDPAKGDLHIQRVPS